MCKRYCTECGFKAPSYQISHNNCPNCSEEGTMEAFKRKKRKRYNGSDRVKNDRHGMMATAMR